MSVSWCKADFMEIKSKSQRGHRSKAGNFNLENGHPVFFTKEQLEPISDLEDKHCGRGALIDLTLVTGASNGLKN